jgi:general secretion pathway protein C
MLSISREALWHSLVRQWLPWLVNSAVALFVALSLTRWLLSVVNEDSLPPAAVPQGADTSVELDIQPLLAASLFGKPSSEPMARSPEAAPPTSLNLVLKGVIVIEGSGLAIMSAEGKTEEMFIVGQEIIPGTTLSEIHADRVILRRGGGFERLTLEGSELTLDIGTAAAGQVVAVQRVVASSSAAQREFVVMRERLRSQVRSPQELLSQAVLVPNVGGGFQLKEVKPDSVIAQLGLREGDIVQSANGQVLNYTDDIRRVYQQLGDTRHLKLELVRNGKKEQLVYQIK